MMGKHLARGGFCAGIDYLLPILDALTIKIGPPSAIRLLSTDSFCAGIDYLLPILDSLTIKVGSKSAIRLLASNSFCANISIVLPVLDILIGKLDKDTAVSILASCSFCVRIDTLLPAVIELQPRFGNKGLKAMFGSDCIPSMSDPEWLKFMLFCDKADVKNVIAYMNKQSVVAKCKKLGWDVCLPVYENASKKQRTQLGFLDLLKAYEVANIVV